ncbi:PhnD/SsuA/transferrin family substrate-binding protein [Methylomarinum vadi]|uniref:PhnD/SsuA/transferrin family substrate-binding protein n=1 Tax=Methylomarinum vadi TaxID=438855 RepID=UPI000566E96C|nr:PhnD/SsuA/transferrin family substrate-binding protein [Methylomarinum vadi]
MKVKVSRALLLFVLSLFPSLLLGVEAEGTANYQTIYFYNPETNINNFASLKISFDTYLAKFGHYRFQPFNEKELFETSLLEGKQNVYLLSSWHYQLLSGRLALQPLMVGVYKGRSMQKKILAVRHDISDVSQLSGKTVACSGSKQYTENLLAEMFGTKGEEILKTIKLILVPKDIDALMAVSFGMATAALSAERSFENLEKINQKQFQLLKPLLTSQQHFLTLVALPAGSRADTQLLDVLAKMGINPEGETRLRMLGLDGWRKLSEQEKLLLQQQGYKGR